MRPQGEIGGIGIGVHSGKRIALSWQTLYNRELNSESRLCNVNGINKKMNGKEGQERYEYDHGDVEGKTIWQMKRMKYKFEEAVDEIVNESKGIHLEEEKYFSNILLENYDIHIP